MKRLNFHKNNEKNESTKRILFPEEHTDTPKEG